jgi:hypothetical protein
MPDKRVEAAKLHVRGVSLTNAALSVKLGADYGSMAKFIRTAAHKVKEFITTFSFFSYQVDSPQRIRKVFEGLPKMLRVQTFFRIAVSIWHRVVNVSA